MNRRTGQVSRQELADLERGINHAKVQNELERAHIQNGKLRQEDKARQTAEEAARAAEAIRKF